MADDKRKSHIYRYIGKTRENGVVVDDEGSYLDFQRSEYYQLKEGGGANYVVTNVRLKWYEDDAGKVPNPARETEILKVIPPDEDQDNPTLWFEVDVVKKIVVRDNDQVINVHFDNSVENRGRKVHIVRVVHKDTTADDMEQYDEGGVISEGDYQKIARTRDKDQHLDVEIITKRAFRDADQLYAIAYNNQPLIDAAETPDQSYGEGEINPPWRFDPLQVPVNVSLGGLAVEFEPKDDGSLESGALTLDLRKGTIVIWGRLAAAVAEAVRARDAGYDVEPAVLKSVVPLIMFGKQREGFRYDWFEGAIGQRPSFLSPWPFPLGDPAGVGVDYIDVTGSYPEGKHAVQVQPSCIGFYCGADDGIPRLFVHIQAGNTAACVNTNETAEWGGLDAHFVPIINHNDASYTDETLDGAYFGNQGQEDRGPQLETDRHHHIVLSWDFTDGNVTLGRDPDVVDDTPFEGYFIKQSKLYCAVDDVNYSGDQLPALWAGGGADPNATVCGTCYELAGGNPTEGGRSRITFTPTSIPVSPIYLPSPLLLKRTATDEGGAIELDDPNQDVVEAELQIFAGLVLDTSKEANRRLFIDRDGKPVPPKQTADALGREADIVLHRVSRWKAGRNTGRLKVDFKRTGTIKRFKPDPSLHGPQDAET